MGYGCSFRRGRVSRPNPPAACTAPRPPLTRGLDFAKQKTGGENNLIFLSLRLPFGQPPPSSEGGMGAVRTRRRVMGADEWDMDVPFVGDGFSRPIPPAGYCTCKWGGKPASYEGDGGGRGIITMAGHCACKLIFFSPSALRAATSLIRGRHWGGGIEGPSRTISPYKENGVRCV